MPFERGLIPWSKGRTRVTDARLEGVALQNAGGSGLVPADKDTLSRLLTEHGSARAVAKAMGWGKSSVARWCRILGITPPCSIHRSARQGESIVASLLPSAEWLAAEDRSAAVDMVWRGIHIDVKSARFLPGSNGTPSWSFGMRKSQVAVADVFVLVALDTSPPRFWVLPARVIPSGRNTRIAIYQSARCQWTAYETAADGLADAVLCAKEIDDAPC